MDIRASWGNVRFVGVTYAAGSDTTKDENEKRVFTGDKHSFLIGMDA